MSRDYDGLFNKMTGKNRPQKHMRPHLEPEAVSRDELQEKLRKLQVGLQHFLATEDVMAHPQIITEILQNRILLEVRGLMWMQVMEEAVVSFPANWWQAVKERFFPGFLLKRFPVQYETHYVELAAIYPELHQRLYLPEEKSFLNLLHEAHWHPGE